MCVKRTILKYISKRKKLSESSLKMLIFFGERHVCRESKDLLTRMTQISERFSGSRTGSEIADYSHVGGSLQRFEKDRCMKVDRFCAVYWCKRPGRRKRKLSRNRQFSLMRPAKKNRHSSTDNTQKGFNPNQSFVKSSAHASRVAHKSTPEHVAMCFDDGCAPWSD